MIRPRVGEAKRVVVVVVVVVVDVVVVGEPHNKKMYRALSLLRASHTSERWG